MDLERLLQQALPKPYGPRPAFEGIDLLRVLWLLGEQPFGRQRLSACLGIGEGSMRNLLSLLSRSKLVRVSKAGCELTAEGKRLLASLRKRVSWSGEVPASLLTFNLPAFGLVLSRAVPFVRKGLEERDAAIREGALGATVLVVKQKKLFFPGTKETVEAALQETLLSLLKANDSDVLLLSYAPAKALAERGAWAAALHLLR